MQILIRQIGNSKGFVIPKALLEQAGLEDAADLTIEDGALVLRQHKKSPREGWAGAAQHIAAQGDDALVLGDFGNASDEQWSW